MGIRSLNTFIKKVCPEAFSTKHINEYTGQTFAIDASILLYKYRHISNINKGCIHSHIIGFLNRIKYYNNYNITPIFVFDGVPPQEKLITLKKRQSIRKKLNDKIELLQELEYNNEEEHVQITDEIKRLSNQIINVSKKHVSECKQLLELLGLPYFDAPDEAEKYCVFLYKNKLVDYVVTDDTDVFTFGGVNILKTSIKNDIIEVDLNVFLNKINYTKEKFIDFCILAGCDYLPFIPSLAINTVFNLFKKHNSIEDIIELNKYNFPEDYNYVNIRKIFTEFNYDIPIIEKKEINITELKLFLEEYKLKQIIFN